MNIIQSDLLSIKVGVLCQAVNSAGAMGAGLALQIAEKWPAIKKNYLDFHREQRLQLGSVQLTPVSDGLWVANIVTQSGYGSQGRHTDYTAVRLGLLSVRILVEGFQLPVYLPYKFACGLGGGDWNIVSKIVEDEIPYAFICRRNGNA